MLNRNFMLLFDIRFKYVDDLDGLFLSMFEVN